MDTQWTTPPWIFWIILWVFIWPLFLIFLRSTRWHDRRGLSEKTPLDILKERYAKGEINKQEFEEKKKDVT
jgi:putative membrane protein